MFSETPQAQWYARNIAEAACLLVLQFNRIYYTVSGKHVYAGKPPTFYREVKRLHASPPYST